MDMELFNIKPAEPAHVSSAYDPFPRKSFLFFLNDYHVGLVCFD